MLHRAIILLHNRYMLRKLLPSEIYSTNPFRKISDVSLSNMNPKINRFIKILSLEVTIVLLLLFLPSTADAAVKTWNPAGCGSVDWGTTGNWTGGSPGTADVATFDGSTSNCSVAIGANIDVQGINIINSYTGTITQGNGNDINLRSSGYVQNASGSTFTGGDSTSDITLDTNGGVFTLTTGVFTAPVGIITTNNNWTISGGTFTHNSGTVKFSASSATYTYTGSATFYNLTFDSYCNNGGTFTIQNTLTVNNTLNVSGSAQIETANVKKLNVSTELTNRSAGVEELPAGQNTVTIQSDIVTNNSLIFITPTTSIAGQSLYLVGKSAGNSFTVGIPSSVSQNIKFNFLIVN